jgi:hypothetical protein
MALQGDGDGIWRPAIGLRLGYLVLGGLSIAFGVACPIGAAQADALVVGLVIGVVFVAMGVGILLLARMSVTLTDDGIEIRNMVGVEHVDWASVREARATTAGVSLVVADRDGFLLRRPKVAMALQRSNIARWFKVDTRAEQLAALINDRVGATPDPDAPGAR